jgi:hypothetical protein
MALGMFEIASEGFQLPHRALSIRSLLVVEQAVCAAWTLMREKPRASFDLAAADEDEVTHELYERLYDEVFDKGVVDGFDTEIFASVRREPKVRNYNGEHLDKMPDLLVEFVDRPVGAMNSQHGLFIECKPVDATHTPGVHYCDKGVVRFVRGDYAWAMRNAMMIAYARSGYTVSPKFSNALAERTALEAKAPPCECGNSKAGATSEVVYITEHRRTFTYVNGSEPLTIVIRHLWLKRD